MAHPKVVTKIEPEVISEAYFEADTELLINMCIANPNDTVYAQITVQVTTGGEQLDVDHFAIEHTEEVKSSLEAIYKDGKVTISGLNDSDVVLEITSLEV